MTVAPALNALAVSAWERPAVVLANRKHPAGTVVRSPLGFWPSYSVTIILYLFSLKGRLP